MTKPITLGVFDSGIGGKTIADSLERDFPEAIIIYIQDSEHVPYGGREKDEIITLTETAIMPLIEAGCDCIVLACNTASVAALDYLRSAYPAQTFIGLEPMIKPAVEITRTGVIAVCATPFTLSSSRYNQLKQTFASDTAVLEPDCSNWAEMIEHNAIDDKNIEAVITSVLENNADVIILACTHYHWIKEKIVAIAGSKATILEPSEAISQRVATLLGLNFGA